MYYDETMLLAFTISLFISVFITEQIINFSERIGIVDSPDEKRKIHRSNIPNMGGVGVFIAAMFAYFAFSDYTNVLRPDKLFSITILLFFMGLKDDLEPIKPWTRFVCEFVCAFFIIYVTDVRIPSMYGIFGIEELPYWASFALTSIFIVACINAYNMIDGIDGLLGSLCLLGTLAFGVAFFATNEWLWVLLCVALAGALIGFLIFNWFPAQIFMGNGGSMFLGTFFACVALRFMQIDHHIFGMFFQISMPHTMALSVIAVPIFDMLTVFFIRIIHKQSPFKADKRHTHHRLIGMGLKHWHAVLVLVGANLLIIVFAYFIQDTGALRSLVFTLLFCTFLQLLLLGLFYLYNHRRLGVDTINKEVDV